MGRKPSAAGGPPSAGEVSVDGTGNAPDVRVVVRNPALRAVHLLRSLRAGDGKVLEHGEKRLGKLGQVRHLARPVVHLGVDVHSVLRAPRRIEAVVPEALEIRGLRAGLRAGDEQVASEAEVQRGKIRIVRRREIRKSAVRRLLRKLVRSEVERAAVGLRAVGLAVKGEERLDVEPRQFCKSRLGNGVRIAGDVVVSLEVRAYRDIDRGLGGANDSNGIDFGRDLSIAVSNLDEDGVAHLPGHAVLVGRHAAKDERSVFDGDRRVAVRALERGTERKRALLVRLEHVYETALAERSEGSAGMADSVRGKCDARKCIVKGERAPVLFGIVRKSFEVEL